MERGTRARGHTAAWLALALALALCWLPGLANAQTRAAKITLDQTQATLFAGDTLAPVSYTHLPHPPAGPASRPSRLALDSRYGAWDNKRDG